MTQKCERNCSREGMTKEEYLQRKDTMGQVHCGGCHGPQLVDLITSVQYYDVDKVLQDIIKCVGVCILNEHLTCIGCGRTMREIDDSGDRRSLPIVIADKKSHMT